MLIKIIKFDNIRIYSTPRGRRPFAEWIQGLDTHARQKIHGFINRIAKGGSRNHLKYLEDGVFEIKINTGPGYRVYFGTTSEKLILLWGGIKRSQNRDIAKAKKLWRIYESNQQL